MSQTDRWRHHHCHVAISLVVRYHTKHLFYLQGAPVDVKQVGRELGVRTCLKVVCGNPATAPVSPRSSSRPRPVTTFGPSATTVTSPTSLVSRTRSPRR